MSEFPWDYKLKLKSPMGCWCANKFQISRLVHSFFRFKHFQEQFEWYLQLLKWSKRYSQKTTVAYIIFFLDSKFFGIPEYRLHFSAKEAIWTFPSLFPTAIYISDPINVKKTCESVKEHKLIFWENVL